MDTNEKNVLRGELAEFVFDSEIEVEDYMKLNELMKMQESIMGDYEAKCIEEK